MHVIYASVTVAIKQNAREWHGTILQCLYKLLQDSDSHESQYWLLALSLHVLQPGELNLKIPGSSVFRD